eukprot:3599982-Pyramimonas_sp.AAC.1
MLWDDHGHVWSSLQLDPMLIRGLPRAGIQRWQMARGAEHRQQAEPGVTSRARCMRSCLGGKGAT